MALERNDQIQEQGLVRLVAKFWGKPRIASLLRSYLRELQHYEDVAWEMFEIRTIDGADEARLIILGKLIGQAKHGLSTEQFRTAIRAKALANRSNGGLSDLFAVLRVVLAPASAAFNVLEPGDASLVVTALDPLDADDVEVAAEVLPAARAAGVNLQITYSTTPALMIWNVSNWNDGSAIGSTQLL